MIDYLLITSFILLVSTLIYWRLRLKIWVNPWLRTSLRIVNGKGEKETRNIIASTKTTITVDKPFDMDSGNVIYVDSER